MNVDLEGVNRTDAKTFLEPVLSLLSHLQHVYLRNSNINFLLYHFRFHIHAKYFHY
jgi:hypothetical protein